MDHKISFWGFMPNFIRKTLPQLLLRSSIYVIQIVGFIWIGLYKDLNLSAGYGQAFSLFNFFYGVFSFTNSDACGMYTAKYQGAEQYKLMLQSYYNGQTVNITIMIISMFFFIRIDLILALIGFDEGTIKVAHFGVQYLIPFCIVSSYSENLKAFLTTLGIYLIFLKNIQVLKNFSTSQILFRFLVFFSSVGS